MRSAFCLVYVGVKLAWRPQSFLNAAQYGDAAALKTHLDNGVDINYQDGWRTSALMLASSHGHLDCVQILLDNGADPNERARENGTPLIWAAESANMEIVELLLENGADPALTDDAGFTAEQHARKNGRDGIANRISN